MTWYVIVETEDGLSVANVPQGGTAEEAAVRSGGVVVDAGPYPAYEEAYDAMLSLQEIDDGEA